MADVAPRDSEATTLGRVLDALSAAVLELVVAPSGVDVPVRNVVIYDAHSPSAGERNDVVLGVGIEPASAAGIAALDDLGSSGVAAIAVKFDEALPPRFEALAIGRGIAVLRVSRIDWGRLYTLIRTATAASVPIGQPYQSDEASNAGFGLVPLGDLFALANAIAAMVGGATTIEDRRLNVLAHSNLGQPVDRVRLDSIVGRKVPEDVQRETEDLYRTIWRSDRAVALRAHRATESRPRLAVAVKAGAEVLGTIWAIEGERPFTAEAEETLVEASRLAALHLMRHAAAGDVERQRRGDLARSVIEGRVPFDAFVREFAEDARPACTIVAFGIDVADDAPSARRSTDRLVDVVPLHAEAFRRSSAAVAIGSKVYLLIVEPTEGSGVRRRELVDEIVRRATHAIAAPVHAAIGSTTIDATGLQASRREADGALRVTRRTGCAVAHVDDVRQQVAILRLCDAVVHDRELQTDLLDRLRAHDDLHDTDYVETVAAYLRSAGNVAQAAELLFVHTNTLRYRMRRLAESTGIDPNDPDTRFVLDLELRIRDLHEPPP